MARTKDEKAQIERGKEAVARADQEVKDLEATAKRLRATIDERKAEIKKAAEGIVDTKKMLTENVAALRKAKAFRKHAKGALAALRRR